MRVKYECSRLASHYQYPLEQINPREIKGFEDYRCLQQYFDKHVNHNLASPPDMVTPDVWEAATDDFTGISLKAKLVFCSKNKGPLFQLILEPLRKERSCRFQRAFGGDRFLYLTVPALMSSNMPSHLNGQHLHVQSHYEKWLRRPKRFLGCTWVPLLVEKKSNKPGRPIHHDEVRGQSVILFATETTQSKIDIEDVINWFFPTRSNVGALQCKAYARLELGFSKTLPTLTFLPSQIREESDIRADGTPESMTFLERGQTLKESFDPDNPKVMNDGCSLLSFGAARRIAQHLGITERPPSVFQARIGCWKGIWMVHDPHLPYDCQNDIWIEVTPSQRKFYRHPEDLSDDTFDRRRTTFEVITWSTPPTSAHLSPTLIPILVDRGVPEEALCNLYRASLTYESKVLRDTVQNEQLLSRWVYTKASVVQIDQENAEMTWLGNLPCSKAQAALYLLEHGFSPHQSPYLARLVQGLMQKQMSDLKKYLKPRVGRSVTVFAIADPLGCLEPGEVHLAFSKDFIDEQSGSYHMMLDSIELVVGRQPALRGSDMQKVRAVFKLELRHLLNVIVFPSRGVFPLAERMQNGDYDGDTFWVTWDPAIVNNFKNAPSPSGLPSPETFGIQVNDRKVDHSFIRFSKKATREFLDFCLNFRCQQDLLGKCTNFHNDYAYTVGTIQSKGVEALADLHDLLVDSSKMGYSFTEDNWRTFIHSDHRIVHQYPDTPLHRRLQKEESLPEISSLVPRDTTDRIIIQIIIPGVDAATKEINDYWRNGNFEDELILRPLRSSQRFAETDPSYSEDITLLIGRIKEIHSAWKTGFFRNPGLQGSMACMRDHYREFQNLAPTTTIWNLYPEMEDVVSSSCTTWDLLKASVAYAEDPGGAFAFRMAGMELGFLKAWSNGRPRTISSNFYRNMKLKSVKQTRVQEYEED